MQTLSATTKAIALSAAILSAANITASAYIEHHVQKNETLWGIAHQYKVSPEEIIKLNPHAAKGLKSGSILKIPDGKDFIPATSLEGFAAEETSDNNVSQSAGSAHTTLKDDNSHQKQQAAIEADGEDMTADDQGNAADYSYIPESKESPREATINRLETPRNPSASQPKVSEDVYTARFGDSFETISKKTGVKATDLIAYNPNLDAKDIREGDNVRLSSDAPHYNSRLASNLADSVLYYAGTPVISEAISQGKDLGVAIMLPFDTQNDELGRQAVLATDFYKGFLLAIKERPAGTQDGIRIYAIDTQCAPEEFATKLSELKDERIDVIIPGDVESQLTQIEEFASDNDIMVLNTINIKDEGYTTNKNVMQCNISQRLMYDKAIDYVTSTYPDYTLVILDAEGGKDEKSAFVDELRSKCTLNGMPVQEISFYGNLKSSDLESLQPDTKYLFITKSGAPEVFDRVSEMLSYYITADPSTDRLKVFGYPDWIVFKGEQAEALHTLGATIYSRFYQDDMSDRTRRMDEAFKTWYGAAQVDVFPAQGSLGYDTGSYLLKLSGNSWPEAQTVTDTTYSGIQSSFKLSHADGYPGYVNDALYIIEYLPGIGTSAKTI